MAAALLLILFTVLALFCIGLVAFSGNLKRSVRVYFSLSIVSLILWVITLYLSNIPSSHTLFYNRIVYVWPILALVLFSLFLSSQYHRRRRREQSLLTIASLAFGFVGLVIAPTSLNVVSVNTRTASGQFSGYNIVPGSLNLLIIVLYAALSLLLMIRFYTVYKTVPERDKRPLRIIFRGLLFAIIVSVLTNLFVPLLFGGSATANIVSNISIIIFILSFTYSVLKYSFLDIRLLVVRSVGYFGGLLSVFAVISAMQLVVLNLFSGGDYFLTQEQWITSAILLSLSTLSFVPLRNLFARITGRVFYKDSYDPAKFLKEFNDRLVETIDIHKLLEETSIAIQETMKSSFCAIVINKAGSKEKYIAGTKNLNIEEKDRDKLYDYLEHYREKMLILDYLEDTELTENTRVLRQILKKHEIGAAIKLVGTSAKTEKTLGYIFLGPKLSGDIYNKTDTEALGIASNELLLGAQNALRFEEISKFNLTLQQKVDEATKELRKTNERLKELDQAKDEFISMASHQLRTPLTSVKGYLSMVLEGDAGRVTTKQRQLLNEGYVSAQRMVYLIADLLNVSRLQTGKFILEPKSTNLAEVVDEEVRQLREAAKIRDIQLVYEKPKDFPLLSVDETKLRQVIMNFIDNAIYYTPSGGRITIALRDTGATVEYTVTDTGIGVPKADQHRLFTKFYRADNAKKARPDGTGLGLFMAKKVVVAHGGAIIFKSQEGKGSTFGFTFPKQKVAHKIAQKNTPSEA